MRARVTDAVRQHMWLICLVVASVFIYLDANDWSPSGGGPDRILSLQYSTAPQFGGSSSCLIPSFTFYARRSERFYLTSCAAKPKYRPWNCFDKDREMFFQYASFIGRSLSSPCGSKDAKECQHWFGDTMIGFWNLLAIRDAILRAYTARLPGHYMETGVWRGGGSIYARALHLALQYNRKSYVMDSFQGLPPARDVGSQYGDNAWHKDAGLRIDLEWVNRSFYDYCVYDPDKVVYGKGFFKDTIPPLREEFLQSKQTFSNIRLDGDMFESTIDVLCYTYDLVDVGGTILIDDFRWDRIVYGAQHAVIQFREIYGIDGPASMPEETLHRVGLQGAFWIKKRQIDKKKSFTPESCMKSFVGRVPMPPGKYKAIRQVWESRHDTKQYDTNY